jgi:archaellum component FlaC
MEPTKTLATISEKNLRKAESVLQDLAIRFAKYQYPENKSIRHKLDRLTAVLNRDAAKQRTHSDESTKQCLATINGLTADIQTFGEKLEQEIGLMQKDGSGQKLSAAAALVWMKNDAERLDGLHYDYEHQLAQFSSERDIYTVQQNQLQAEQLSISCELKEMLKEDQRLASEDRSSDIKMEIGILQQKMVALYQKAADLCQVPYRAEFDITERIKFAEHELTDISSQIKQLNELLNDLPNQVAATKSVKRSKNKKPSNLESDVERIKDAVREKQELLKELLRIKQELIKLNQLLKTARLDLAGELARLERQKARTTLLNEIKEKQENQKQTLILIRDKLAEIETGIADLHATQQKIREQKQFYSQRQAVITKLQHNIGDCQLRLISEQTKLQSITPSAAIWFNSIRHRIIEIRKNISFGNPFRLLLPYQCYVRFVTGLMIRKDLILAERTLLQLGFLSSEYVEQADIFNRKNKRGQRLCLDILGC